MGFNTTVVVLNDALHEISEDPKFGRKLAEAIMLLGGPHKLHNDVSAGGHCNAATVVETHHADELVAVAVGGNTASVLGYGGSYRATDLDVVRTLAGRLGYTLHKKPSTPRGKKR
jgi:hypothetical protein